MNRKSIFHSRFGIVWPVLLLHFVIFQLASAAESASEDGYAAFVENSISGSKNAAVERLQRVGEAKEAFSGSARRVQSVGNRKQMERKNSNEQVSQSSDSREVTMAALLAVYDADGNGSLDPDEQTSIRKDRMLATVPLSPIVVRWKKMEKQIGANNAISEAEKIRILETIHRRINEAEGHVDDD